MRDTHQHSTHPCVPRPSTTPTHARNAGARCTQLRATPQRSTLTHPCVPTPQHRTHPCVPTPNPCVPTPQGWTAPACAAVVMMSDRARQMMESTESDSFCCNLKKWTEVLDPLQATAPRRVAQRSHLNCVRRQTLTPSLCASTNAHTLIVCVDKRSHPQSEHRPKTVATPHRG